VKAVAQEMEEMGRHFARFSKQMGMDGMDMIDDMGFNMRIGGMKLTDYVRDSIKNPDKHQKDRMPEIDTDMGSVMKWADEAMASISALMGGNVNKDTFKPFSKVEPLTAVLALDPFEYANPLDILVQQYNAVPLMKKFSALSAYLPRINKKATEAIIDISQTAQRAIESLAKAEEEAKEKLEEWYENALEAAKSLEEMEAVRLRYKIKLHEHHVEFFNRYNLTHTPYWNQATQVAAMTYKKIERYVPKMYTEIMTHIVAISDAKVREKQENKLYNVLSVAIQAGMANVLTAYSIMEYQDVRMCSCDLDEINQAREKLRQLEKKLGNEYCERQRKAMNSLKNGEIDFNSDWYKNHLKKWEHKIDLGFTQYVTGDYYAIEKTNIWTPVGSYESSSFVNNISNTGTKSADLTLGPSVGAFSLEAKFGYTVDLTRDKSGRTHIRDIDLRSSLEGKVGYGPLAATAGISASIAKGTKVYGKVGLTGNGYIDKLKSKALGEKLAAWSGAPGIPKIPDLTLNLWSGEYVF